MESTTALATPLELVYPPFTNQEAEWLANDAETVDRWRQGSVYLIAIRAESKFEGITVVAPTNQGPALIRGSLVSDELHDEFEIDVDGLLQYEQVRSEEDMEIGVDFGPKIISVQAGTMKELADDRARLVDFFTPEKLIYDRGRLHPSVRGLPRVREFATYDLLYVGIAKGSDVYERLVKGAHHARQKILSNEYPRLSGARVTDEMVFFVFSPKHFTVRVLGDEPTFSNPTPAETELLRRSVVADVEKAFIKLLDPTYNLQKYHRYPEGVDGLYARELIGYGYYLNENLTFRTATAEFRGRTQVIRLGAREERIFDNEADFIVVHGDEVALHRGEGD